MDILEICAVLCTSLLALIYLKMRQIFQILAHDATVGTSVSINSAAKGIIALVGHDSVRDSADPGTGWMNEVVSQLNIIQGELEYIKQNTDYLTPKREPFDPYADWESSKENR